MRKRQPNPELIDAANPEWTHAASRRARAASEVLPELLGAEAAAQLLKPRGRPKSPTTKIHLNLRLDADIVQAFKAKGAGWQTRMNSALREWLKTH